MTSETSVFHMLTGMNAKKNPAVGNLAERIQVAIDQEKMINQDIHNIRGILSSNIGEVIAEIINEKPEI